MAKHQRICSIPECGKRHFGRGLCNTHYVALRRAEDPDYSKRMFEKRERKLCSIEGCGKFTRYGKLCAAHYFRKLRHGDPLSGGTSPGEPMAWIRSHLDHGSDDCMPWPFAHGSRGDALITINHRQVSAPRYLCTMVYGEPENPSFDAAHSCGMGHEGCMNYRHVRWASRSDNMLDKHHHGTMARGEMSHWATLTESQVLEIRSLRGKLSLDDLSEIFGVHRATISLIHLRKNWAWLPD